MRISLRIITFFILFSTLFILPANALQGSFFNNATERTGEIYIRSGNGQFISQIYDYSKTNQQLKGVVLISDISNDTTAKLIIQGSTDNFDTIADSNKFLIKNGHNKYFIDGGLKGSYQRYVIKSDSRATIKPQIIETATLPNPRGFMGFIIFVIAATAGVGVMKLSGLIKSHLKSKASVVLFIAISFLFIAPALGTATIDVQTADGTRTPETQLTVTGQSPNTNYILQVQSDVGSWTTIKEFMTDGGGNYRVTKELDFSNYFINATTSGYTFRLKKQSDDTVVDAKTYDYGLMVTKYFDLFDHYDNFVLDTATWSYNVWANQGYSLNDEHYEDGTTWFNRLQGGSDYDQVGMEVSTVDKYGWDAINYINLANWSKDSGSGYGKAYLEVIGAVNNYTLGSWTGGFHLTNNFTVYYNQSEQSFQGYYNDTLIGQVSAPKQDYRVNLKTGTRPLYDFDWQITNIDSWQIKNIQTSQPIDPYVSDVGVTDWQTYDIDTNGVKTAQFTVNNNTYSFVDDVPNSNSLDLSFIGDGTLNYFKLYYEPSTYLKLLQPADNYAIKSGESPNNFQFKYQIPADYQQGEIFLKINDAPYGVIDYLTDLDGDCVSGALVTDSCYNHTLSIDSSILSQETGTFNWSILYDNYLATDSSIEGNTIESATRKLRVLESLSTVKSLYPPNDVVLTTSKPPFNFEVVAFTSANLNVYIDSNLQYSTAVSDTTDRVEWTPIGGLLIGDHTYYAELVKDGTVLANTSTRQFNINLSIKDNYSVSLKNPSDGYNSQDTNVTFNYSIYNTAPADGSLFLNGLSINTQSVDLLWTPIDLTKYLTPDTYTWYATVSPDTNNLTIASKSRSLEIFANVSLSAIKPFDGERIGQPPVDFSANLATNAGGDLMLLVDSRQRGVKTISSGYNSKESFTIDSDLSAGKHYYQFIFNQNNGGNYYSDVRTFELAQGVEDVSIFKGGEIGNAAAIFEDLFGLDRQGALALFSFLIVMSVAVAVGVVADSGEIMGLTIAVGMGVFTVMNWLPSWLGIVIIVIAGYLVASEVKGG